MGFGAPLGGLQIRTMTTLSVTEAKARLNELARIAYAQHERFTPYQEWHPGRQC